MKFVVVLAAVALCAVAFQKPQFKIPDLKKARGSGSFSPKKLSCAYNLKYTMTTIQDGEEESIYGKEKMYGRHMLAYMEIEDNGTKIESYDLLRADIHDEGKPDSGAMFTYTKVKPEDGETLYSCSFEGYADPYETAYNTLSPIHTMLETFAEMGDDIPYQSKEKTTFHDVKCTKYDLGYGMVIYADSDDYIIGIYVDYTVYAVEFFFEYGDVEKSDFAIPDKYDGCSAYEAAYKKPDEKDCKIEKKDDGDDSSAASTIKAVVGVVLAMMMVILF